MPDILFRVHFHGDESPINIPAANPVDARKQAGKARPDALIKKIKVVKGD